MYQCGLIRASLHFIDVKSCVDGGPDQVGIIKSIAGRFDWPFNKYF